MSAGLDVEHVLVDLFRAASPIRHEPLATKVAEEWAAKAEAKVREAVAAWLESEASDSSYRDPYEITEALLNLATAVRDA